MKFLSSIVFSFVFLICTSVGARYCNSPYCAMCNALFGPISGYESVVMNAPVPKIESTPMEAVDTMLDNLDLKSTDVLYDLGCGDARFLIRARKRFGCRGLGIEIDPTTAEYARLKVREAGCGGIRIVTGDAASYDLSGADAVVMYLLPDGMRRLIPRIRTRRIVTYQHAPFSLNCRKVQTKVGSIFVVIPSKPVSLMFGMW